MMDLATTTTFKTFARSRSMSDTKGDMQVKLKMALDAYRGLKERLQNVIADLNLHVLAQANVIGLTTSGLARQLNLVRRLPSKVLLVEEAAEVLEAHILTTLLPNLEHVLLIDDHQQLRPRIANYDLSCENPRGQCGLDISLFERLVMPQFGSTQGAIPLSTLETQRRMHPSIANLVRNTLYPRLQDHPTLSEYPEVVGRRRRLYWLNHNKQEDPIDFHSTSHTNDWEIEMTSALLSHIVRQGVYKPNDIAILTPYLGQLRKLRSRLRKMYEILIDDRDVEDLQKEGDHEPLAKPQVTRGTLLQALRLASVDNFQGEEAKIVVLSLVRSNEQNNCGFLRTFNRVNVLLSRAQHGMYIIGNAQTQSSVPMWRDVLHMLQESGNIGNALQLACPRHPETAIEVSEPDDFLRVAPEGGCNLRCGKPLPCGHLCEKGCHSDLFHDAQQCSKPCERIMCESGHHCPQLCSEKCVEVCSQIIVGIDIELPCGHHKYSMPCYHYENQDRIICDVVEPKTVPACRHVVQTPCHEDVEAPNYQCTATCGASLPCSSDHSCKKKCWQCTKRSGEDILAVNHGQCLGKCNKKYDDCVHSHHDGTCHKGSPCPPCTATVDDSCVHTRRTRICYQPYQPCTEEIEVPDLHGQLVSLPCSLPRADTQSSKRCTRQLSCGHQCLSLDSEPCSAYVCLQCSTDENIKAVLAQKATNLMKDPIISPACGHIAKMSELDGYVAVCGEGAASGLGDHVFMKELGCPTCGKYLDSVLRYSSLTKAARLDDAAKNHHIRASKTTAQLSERLSKGIDQLHATLEKAAVPSQDVHIDGDPTTQIQMVKQIDLTMNTRRYEQLCQIRNDIFRHTTLLQDIEGPFELLRADSEKVDSKQDNKLSRKFVPPKVAGLYLAAIVLLAQCDLAMVTDLVQRQEKKGDGTKTSAVTVDFKINRERCMRLVSEADKANMCLQKVQGHVLWALYPSLECRVSEKSIDTEYLEVEATNHLDEARGLCESFSESTPLIVAIDDSLEASLSDIRTGGKVTKIQDPVSITEILFSNLGTWYKCTNGHPFTTATTDVAAADAVCYYCGEGTKTKGSAKGEGMEEGGEAETAADGEDLIGL